MLTADTITDEQIRELRTDVLLRGERRNDIATLEVCAVALGKTSRRHSLNAYGECSSWCAACPERSAARARCAEILNARTKAGVL